MHALSICFSPTRLALGFLQSGREIGSGCSGGRFPHRRGTGSPSSCAQFPQHRASTPSLRTSVPKAPGFLEKIALAILDERPRIFQKMTLAVWCGLYVVIIWFGGLSVWIYAVLGFLYGFMCFLYGVMWFQGGSCGFIWSLCDFIWFLYGFVVFLSGFMWFL